MTSGVVTRSPFRNSLVSPSRPSIWRDLGTAAVDDDRTQTGIPEEGDVLGERALEGVVDHRVAAVLDDDQRAAEPLEPRQRLDEGLRLARGDAQGRGVDDAADGAGGGGAGGRGHVL